MYNGQDTSEFQTAIFRFYIFICLFFLEKEFRFLDTFFN